MINEEQDNELKEGVLYISRGLPQMCPKYLTENDLW